MGQARAGRTLGGAGRCGVLVAGKLGKQCLLDLLRQAAATGRLEEGGDIAAALRRLRQERVHGGVQLLEADLTAMEGVE
jgi:hypothetical protein